MTILSKAKKLFSIDKKHYSNIEKLLLDSLSKEEQLIKLANL